MALPIRRTIPLAFVAAALAGCADGYYLQAASGHVELMSSREDIADLIAEESTPEELRAQLLIVTDALAFAADELALPDNGSYRDFVDVGRPFVTWNVVAAPALSLDPIEHCFPVAGCVAYRGYFDRDEAIAAADELRAEGNDASVTGARAYSTLGWFRDPVPSTIVFDAPYDLVGTIFHELAHQRVYVAGDTTFNESYAVTVERAGIEAWLAEIGDAGLTADYRLRAARRDAFFDLLLGARADLAALYASPASEEGKLAGKARIFAELGADYERLKRSWGGYAGFDGFFGTDLNNAKLALVATYNSAVPAFEALLAAEGGDFAAFHEAVEALAALPPAERAAFTAGGGM